MMMFSPLHQLLIETFGFLNGLSYKPEPEIENDFWQKIAEGSSLFQDEREQIITVALPIFAIFRTQKGLSLPMRMRQCSGDIQAAYKDFREFCEGRASLESASRTSLTRLTDLIREVQAHINIPKKPISEEVQTSPPRRACMPPSSQDLSTCTVVPVGGLDQSRHSTAFSTVKPGLPLGRSPAVPKCARKITFSLSPLSSPQLSSRDDDNEGRASKRLRAEKEKSGRGTAEEIPSCSPRSSSSRES